MALDPAESSRSPSVRILGSNPKAAALMLLAAVLYSFMPLAVVLSGSEEHPFLFNGGWRLGIAVGYCIYLAVSFSGLFFSWTVWKLALRRMYSFDILLVMIAYFNVALFAMSIKHLDVSAAIMLAAISPVVMIGITGVRHLVHADEEGVQDGLPGEKAFTPAKVVFILLGVAGALFIVFGQLAFDQKRSESSVDTILWLGILLALVSALIYGLNRRALPWGAGLRRALPADLVERSGKDTESIDLFCSTAAGFIASVAVVPICLAIGVGWGESIFSGDSVGNIPIYEILPVNLQVFNVQVFNVLLLIVLAGALTYPVAGIAWRRANIIARHSGINAFEQIRPVFSLGWLLLFTFLVVRLGFGGDGLDAIEIKVRGDYLAIGAVAIIIANLLLNFEAEIRWGFKALIMALGGCGTFVYFRADLFKMLDIGEKSWIAQHYFEVVGLSATIFTLLLAFRVANVVTRSHAEETQAFTLFRRLDMFVKRGVIEPEILEHVIRLDAPRNQADLREAYINARACVANVDRENIDERLAMNDVEAGLDAMARSKQLGLVLGELFALIIFAGITIFFALLSRPDVGDKDMFSRFLVDIFAMLISAVIIFLTVNVWDLHHERGVKQLEWMPAEQTGGSGRPGSQLEQGEYVVVFHGRDSQMSDKWLSVIVGVVIVLVYTALLGYEYLCWFRTCCN